MSTQVAATIPFVQARDIGGKQRPSLISIKISDTTARKGAAFAISNNQHRTSGLNHVAHYIVDESDLYQCVPENRIAGASKSAIKGSINVLMCSELVESSLFFTSDKRKSAFDRTAELISKLCFFYKINVQYLDPGAASAWNKLNFKSHSGIIVYPEACWPKNEFLDLVHSKIG